MKSLLSVHVHVAVKTSHRDSPKCLIHTAGICTYIGSSNGFTVETMTTKWK